VQSLRELLFGWTRQPLVTLQVAVVLVLVIACANVAALLLSRASVRQGEIAMRVALGAGRMRIVRQLLTESVLLSLAGGALGLLIAWWGVRGLTAMSPPIGSPRMAGISLDLRIVALTGVLSVLTGVIFGLAPALLASQSSPGPPLRESDAAAAIGRRYSIRTALVTAQLALALILLIGFGLLINSFVRLSGRSLNFDPAGLLTFEFRTDVGQQRVGLHRGLPYFEITGAPSQTMTQVLERLQAINGVESAGGSSFPAVNSLIVPMVAVTIDATGPRTAGEREPFRTAYFLVTPNFFHTMRTPFVRGRDVTDGDTSSRPWVAIVNETAARQFWPGDDPIGRTLTIDGAPEEQPREVIGIVRDIPTRHGQVEPQPIVYTSYLQQPSRYAAPFGGGIFGQMTFAVRHRSDPLSLVPAIRKAVGEIESRPISSVTTEEQRFQYGMQRMRYNLFLVGVLACTAAVLAMVGVYGMLAYSVSLRTREIGIRKALGAGTGGVAAFVGRYVLTMIAAGVALGVAGAVAFSRLIAAQLWGITPTDPSTFAVVSLVLVTAALLACVGPTRRAIAVDPTVALRCE
jgi:putative ABC transport system permease protein